MTRLPFGSGARRRRAELAAVEAEITAFGIALDEHGFAPGAADATDAMRDDLGRALDAYEEAKRVFVGDRDREDALDVLRALDEGRHALARLDARVAGRPLPRRHPLCFFDPRHGRATTEIAWAPDGGAPRNVPVCAADAVRLTDVDSGRVRERRPPRPRSAAPTRLPTATRHSTAGRPQQLRGPGHGPRGEPREGVGNVVGHVHFPAPKRPAVLSVRTNGAAALTLIHQEQNKREKRYGLGAPDRTVTAMLPLPRSGHGGGAHFELVFHETAGIGWTVESLPVDSVPRFRARLEGHASGLLHYTGEAGPGTIHHEHPGPFTLHALDADLEEWAMVVSGKGKAVTPFQWPGPGYYTLRARGAWTLTPSETGPSA